MKILYVLNKLSHTSIPLEMARKISQEHEITVLSLYDSNKTSSYVKKISSANYDVVSCNLKKNYLSGIKAFKKTVANEEFDIIHTHQTLSGSLARWLAKSSNETKVVHTVHANHNSFNLKQNFIIGNTLKYADVIVANSETTLKGLKNWQFKKVTDVEKKVIYNGVDSEKVLSASQKNIRPLMDDREINPDDFVFGMVGRLVKVKNHKNVILAFEDFLNKTDLNINFKLVIIGDGPEKENLDNLISSSEVLHKRVVFLGLQPREKVYSFLKRFDAYILPSFYEGFCNSLVEALISGVPSIVSDIPIFKELFKGEGVLTFDPNDKNQIKDKMVQIVQDSPNEIFKQNSVNSLIQKYDLSVSYSEYINLYESILNKKVRR